MLPVYFALVGGFVAIFGELYYLYCTIRGKVQPNRVTWFFWGIFPLIAFVAQLAQGVGVISWVTFIAGFIPLLVFFASFFNPKAYWKIERLDYLFAAIAVVGVVLWVTTKEPNYAIVFAVLADLAATLPTFIKAYKFPESESGLSYGVAGAGYLMALLAVQVWTFEHSAVLVYFVLQNLVLTVFASRRRKTVSDVVSSNL